MVITVSPSQVEDPLGATENPEDYRPRFQAGVGYSSRPNYAECYDFCARSREYPTSHQGPEGAREDLEDAELPGIVGKVFGPVRDRVLDIEDFIVEKLRKDPRYDLVITGHSLGAGNATLISLKLNYEHHFAKIRGLEIVKVRCFAFAPPPFYMPNDSSKFSEATKNTYSFMHENDSVPFIP